MDELMPSVSVITPSYQRAHLLARALRSVLGQEYGDLELVVVDDGSTDDTASVVAALGDPRVRYLCFEKNRGIGAARHAGVEEARGEIVAFLDSDDVWKPGKLGTLVRILGRHPQVDLVFSDFENIDHTSGERERGFAKTAAALGRLRVSPLESEWWLVEEGALQAMLEANFIGTSSVVALRRSVFSRAGNFRPDLSGPEDLEMWWRAVLFGARLAYTHAALVERHKDDGSITARTRSFVPRYLRAMDACEEAARKAGRLDLLPHLRVARARAFRALIDACGVDGRRGEALSAFRQGLRHGSALLAVRELAAAMAGPRLVGSWRRVRAGGRIDTQDLS
jgi:glycosyltransferase involved in cell wall biosynthesis